MPVIPKGETEKIKILAFEQPDYSSSSIDEFSAFINPAELTLSNEIEYETTQGHGTTGARMNFKKEKPGDITISFMLDGTGAVGRTLDVQGKIEDFKRVTGFNGNIHRPNYLMIMWGSIEIKKCILKNVSIVYKLFRPDGTPLRALINAVFTDNIDDQSRVAAERKTSPDLTHLKVVSEGDTLPLMTFKIYGDIKYYLEIAQINNLDDFTCLKPGQKLFFPPFEKVVK